MKHVILLIFVFLTSSIYGADRYTLKETTKGLRRPVKYVATPENGIALVLEQAGYIRVIKDNKLEKAPLADLTDRVHFDENETGLLGLALHPDFSKNNRIFINYTTRQKGKLQTRVSEFTALINDRSFDKKSEKVLLEFDQPYSNHNGGEVEFGPDGYLYISTGDGGLAGDPGNRAQNLNNLLGKILRLDVSSSDGKYEIPETNPFVKRSDGARKEIFAYGLRNPWRFAFNSKTKELWTGDVGQNDYEEVDIIEAGKNYGWRLMEGNHCYNPTSCNTNNPDLVKPIHEYPRNEGQSITGGVFYFGKLLPELKGKYIYGDYASGAIWALGRNEKTNKYENIKLVGSATNPAAFGIDHDGEVVIVNHSGRLHRLSKK